MKCEFCSEEITIKYASGRFCNRICSNKFASNKNKEEKNKKISDSLKGRESHRKGKRYEKPSKKTIEKISFSLKKYFDKKGRKPLYLKRLQNKISVSNYRARKIRLTPKDANLELIKKIYEFCPKGYHVDHIQSLSKGGLHHQDNLQYLPCSENCRKADDREYNKELAINWKDLVKL